MAFTLTESAINAKERTILETSLLVEIDGYPNYFSIGSILSLVRIGATGLYIDGTWLIGGNTSREDVLNYITWDGTSSSISQQLQQDKGGATSVTSMQISLLDVGGEVTRLISPGYEVTDILGRQAWVYLGFHGTVFPVDYITLFVGVVDEIISGANITLNISNPEQRKRQDIYIKAESNLTAAITDSQTTIPVVDTSTFFEADDGGIVTTYLKIDDEIIFYDVISGNDFTTCARGQFGTIAAAHDDDASVSSFYRLRDTATGLALKIMLSGPDEYYKTDIPIQSYGTDTINFSNIDVVTKYGLTVGDFITTTGSTNGGNNQSFLEVSSIVVADGSSEVTIIGSFTVEVDSPATASFKSKYNVLPDGLGMGGHEVDVDEFERIETIYAGSNLTYDFYLTDTMKAKDFIDKELLYPSNFFTIPRKGKVSIGAVSPPLAVGSLPVLDKNTLTKPEGIKSSRSLGKYFYNTIVYKYNYDAVETDKPLNGVIFIDADSKTQIPVGTKALTIKSKGMRNNAATTSSVDVNSRRLLARYKNAAEMFKVTGFFSELFNVDVGDSVLFGDESMPIVDSKRGVRGLTPRLCEVVDKKMDIKTGQVSMSLVDTNYLTDGRYGIFSPSSIIGVGSTTSTIVITDSYGTTSPDIEKNKWLPYVGMNLLIRNIDWSTTYTSKLLGFASNYVMNIEPIGASVAAGFIVDIAQYPDNAIEDENRVYKSVFCFSNPKVDVTSGVDDFSFNVGAGDISKFIVGSQLMLHNADWSVTSPDVRILSVGATLITVDESLGFTPTSSYDVELIGFKDGGSAYRFL